MANPEQAPTPTGASVSSCAATDCAHNDDRSCTATQVMISLEGDRPVCGSYTPETPAARP